MKSGFLGVLACIVPAAISIVKTPATAATLTAPLYLTGFNGTQHVLSVVSVSGSVKPIIQFSNTVSEGGLAIDANQNAYVSIETGTTGADFVEKITPQGAGSTYASGLSSLSSLTFDRSGNLYVSEETIGKVLKITPGGVKTTYATVPAEAECLAFDSNGNLFVDTLVGFVYKVTPGGTVSKFSSTSVAGQAVGIDSADNLYYTVGHSIDKVTPAGAVSVLGQSSDGQDSFGGDAVDRFGNVFVANYNSGSSTESIGEFSPNGTYQTVQALSGFRGQSFIVIVPEPASLSLLIMPATVLLGRHRQRSL